MLDKDFHNRKSHGYSWTLLCNGSCITHNPYIAYITFSQVAQGYSRTSLCSGSCMSHSVWAYTNDLHSSHSSHQTFRLTPDIAYITFRSSCPRLFPDLIGQRLLHMSHSVWAYTNNLPFITFQPYSWTMLFKGSCTSPKQYLTFSLHSQGCISDVRTRSRALEGAGHAPEAWWGSDSIQYGGWKCKWCLTPQEHVPLPPYY